MKHERKNQSLKAVLISKPFSLKLVMYFAPIPAKSKNIVAAFHSGLYAEIICLLIIFALLVVIEDFKAKTN